MPTNLQAEWAALNQMTVAQLRAQYLRVFGEPSASHNRVWLLRKIAWRIQALAEGGLSERARRRAAELANDADLRLSPPRAPARPMLPMAAGLLDGRDARLVTGAVIQRLYKGRLLEVKVLADGFEHDGAAYRSLSAVAKAVTGSHCSGYRFFRLRPSEGA